MIGAAALSLVKTVVGGVSGYFTRKQNNKAAAVSAKAKLDLMKTTGKQQIDLTDAEWEALAQKGQGETWKDEYITVVITAPIVMVLSGAVWDAFTGNARLLSGALMGVKHLKDLGLDFDVLTTAVVLAAIGLKMWRAK